MTKEMKISAAEAKRILKEEHVITIDTSSKHDLRVIKDFFYGLKYAPNEFDENSPAGVVFFNLCVCYQNAGSVGEGQIGNIIWGFRQSGIPGEVTFDGFKELKKHKYIDFITPTGEYIFGDPTEQMFFRWTQKFFDMLITDPKTEKIDMERVETEDTTWDKVK